MCQSALLSSRSESIPRSSSQRLAATATTPTSPPAKRPTTVGDLRGGKGRAVSGEVAPRRQTIVQVRMRLPPASQHDEIGRASCRERAKSQETAESEER